MGRRKQFCVNGHDTDKVGRTKSHACRACVNQNTTKGHRENGDYKRKMQLWRTDRYQERYEAAIQANGGSTACAICHPEKAYMVVDHLHGTEKVRGLLCNSCNVALGLLKEDEELFLSALAYIKERS